jgi:Lrp/AsnC family leucine-responsive transcriptional regulator
MKNIAPKLIDMLKEGNCTPQIATIARKTKEPSTTIHYNIKKLEKEGAIRAYHAVFDFKKIGRGFSTFVLLSISSEEYANPERLANEFSRHPNIESVDICTGDWEIILKVRVKDEQEYYALLKNVISKKGVSKIKSLVSLKEIKGDFLKL